MATDTPRHTITVFQVPNEESDDTVWTVQCPGVSDRSGCRLWYACQVAETGTTEFDPVGDGKNIQTYVNRGCSHEPTEDEIDEQEYFAHGEVHQRIDYDWMTPSNHCALMQGEGNDSIYDVAREAGLGTWPVEIHYEGDGEWYVNLIEEKEQA